MSIEHFIEKLNQLVEEFILDSFDEKIMNHFQTLQEDYENLYELRKFSEKCVFWIAFDDNCFELLIDSIFRAPRTIDKWILQSNIDVNEYVKEEEFLTLSQYLQEVGFLREDITSVDYLLRQYVKYYLYQLCGRDDNEFEQLLFLVITLQENQFIPK